jgi:hypothetical protein
MGFVGGLLDFTELYLYLYIYLWEGLCSFKCATLLPFCDSDCP